MFEKIKSLLYRLLRWSEKYAKTDMVHFFSANFWLNSSRIISIGLGMVLTVAFANLLPPEVFGTYKYVIAAGGMVATFSLNGLMAALTRAVAQGKMHVIPSVVRAGMLWSLPASIAALGIGIYYFMQGNSELGFAFVIIAANNSLSNGFGMTKGVWYAAGEYKNGTLLNLPKVIVPFIIIFLTIVFTKNILWILLAYFGSNLLFSFFGYWLILWKFKVKKSKEDVPETIKYGKQMTVLGFFQLASGQIDQLLLFHFVGPAQLAIYALALAPVNEAANLLNNFLTVLFPKIARKTEREVHTTLPTRLRQMFLASAVLTVIYILAIPFLFKYLFPKYLSSVFVSQVLALTILLQPKGVIDVFLSAHGQVANRSKIILTSQAIEFSLFFVLIPFFGLWGAVAATVLSELLAAVIYIGMYLRIRAESRKKESSL